MASGPFSWLIMPQGPSSSPPVGKKLIWEAERGGLKGGYSPYCASAYFRNALSFRCNVFPPSTSHSQTMSVCQPKEARSIWFFASRSILR